MSRRFLISAVAALTLAVGATEAKAATVIDFASPLYNGANGATSFSTNDQGVVVTVSTSTGTLAHNAQGFGVNGSTSLDDPNEVGLGELFLTGFNPAQNVQSVAIERLFTNDPFFPFYEVGEYQVNNGGWTPFFANSATGLFTLNIGQDAVQSLGFRGTLGFFADNDFAVRSVTLQQTPVPEPASMILLGSGLAGAYMQRRRKKNQAI